MINTILPPNCFYIPNFLPDADILFDHFSKELDRKQYPITMFGKQMMQPRLVCFYGDDKVKYSYSQTKLIGI